MGKKLAPVVVVLAAIIALIVWKASRHHEVAPQDAEHGSAVSVRVPRPPALPAQVSGHVTPATAHATIALAQSSLADKLGGGEHAPLFATTDASGAWTIDKIPPGEYVATASAPGMLPASHAKFAIASGERRTGIDFALASGGTPVRGTISDFGGGPIAGARVSAVEDGIRELSATRAPYLAVTDADGKYELSLPDGSYSLRARHDDYTPAHHEVELAGKPKTVDFKLVPGGTIHGVVVARATGKPVPGAHVSARGQHLRDFSGGEASADAEGKFTLHGLASGALSLEAAAAGFASAQPTRVELGIGESVDGVRVLVDRAVSISGRVVEKGTQNGVAGVMIGAWSMGAQSQARAPDPTAADGAFEIVGVKPGSYFLFAFGENKMPELGKTVEVADKDVTGVIVEMATGATLSGHVDPPGKASIGIAMQGEIGLGNMMEVIKTAFVRGDSDASGAWKLEHVPHGKFTLVASTAEGPAGKLPVVVADRDQRDLVIALETRASISGRVVDTKGAPVAGVKVAANSEKHDMGMMIAGSALGRGGATSGADGSFKIVGLEAGKYRVQAEDWEDMAMVMENMKKQPPPIEVAAGAEKTGVVVTVEARDGVIRGVVTTGGSATPDAWVTAQLQPAEGTPAKMAEYMYFGATQPVLTDANGKFVIDHLRAGTYTLVAEGPRGASRGEKAGAKPGDNATIELQPLGTLSGHVLNRAAPITSFDLECRGPVGPIDRHVDAADGGYTLEHLAPGHYRCAASADAGNAVGEVDVPAGAATLELALQPWASVTGTVVSVITGAPVPHVLAVAQGDVGGDKAMVSAILGGGGPETDATGRFTIDHVGNGTGHVMLWPRVSITRPLASKDYTATAGQKIDLGAIKVVPPRDGDAGTLGMDTTLSADSLEVTMVSTGGPAASAGIVVGDKITAIEGHTISELTPMIASQLVASGTLAAGQTLQLTLARGTTVSVTAAKW